MVKRLKKREKLYYKIGEAASCTDLQPHVLRYWETVFPQLEPEKTPTGQRLYTRESIDTILRIKHLLYDKKFTIEGAVKALEQTGEGKTPGTTADQAHCAPPQAAPPSGARVTSQNQPHLKVAHLESIITTQKRDISDLKDQLDEQITRSDRLEAELANATMLLAKAKAALLHLTD